MSPLNSPATEASRESDVLLEDLNKPQQMMTRQDQDNSHTPRGIEKTEKGKRAHACRFPGCDKFFTRQEHLKTSQAQTQDRCEHTLFGYD
ncbi:hypothetical protein PENARI_c008G04046 [Penicillium arizonense]|uniref:C2H2-type domain-containing protein n=1 Tax=Penicillium arizonense TaxID=1835702 RepID=A0A1F5LJM0_PENAI|nr:hypothetical protein PENARI_c008G04046 [Penicillium arizonense]OGE53404.1 hypothetical protein PENARI_c008G04046 [Penicillium arizonense]